MGAWMGEVGSLIELKCPASAGRSQAVDYSIETTLGGVDKAQVGRTISREWDLEVGPAHPGATTALARFQHGMYGLGPWWFIDPWAAVSNVLTPAASMPGPTHKSWTGAGVPTGAWQVPGMGLVRHSVIPDGGLITLGDGTPVVPGQPLTGGAWVSGSGAVWVQTVDAAGAIVDNVSTRVSGTEPVRVSATIPVVSGSAVSARLRVTDAMQVGLPSLSWTRTAQPWAPGQGTARALVESIDTTPAIAVPDGGVLGTHRARIIEMRG